MAFVFLILVFFIDQRGYLISIAYCSFYHLFYCYMLYGNEPPHDKTNIMACTPSEDSLSLGIHPVWVWSESLLSAWIKVGSLATYWAHSEDSDETGRMPRLIWFFAGRKVILLILSWDGSNTDDTKSKIVTYKVHDCLLFCWLCCALLKRSLCPIFAKH